MEEVSPDEISDVGAGESPNEAEKNDRDGEFGSAGEKFTH